VTVRIVEGRLVEGDTITLVYGDTSSGSPGAISGTRAGIHLFSAWVDPRGDRQGPCGGFCPAGPPQQVRCLPGAPVASVLTVPSRAAQGEPLTAHLGLQDRFGNPLPPGEGRVALAGSSWSVVARGTAELRAGDRGVIRDAIRVRGTGVHRITAHPPGGLPPAASNPVEVAASDSGLRIFWGDLHAHTGLSDGVGTPGEAYEFAQQVACLDFCALTDHDTMLDADTWEAVCEAAAECQDPLRFVTLCGYEYTNRRHGGDRAVYHFTDNGPLLRSQDPEYDHPLKLLDALEPLPALVIPLHPARPRAEVDWSVHSPELQRLVEVYSSGGNCEYAGNPRPVTWGTQRSFPPVAQQSTVQAALAAGHRLGLVCGSDSHCGRPGHGGWIGAYSKRRGYRGGLTAVLARELTRAALWDALRKRRCYGTTGARIIMHLTIDGDPMGSELRRPAGSELPLQARVAGTDELVAVEVLRNSEVAFTGAAGAHEARLNESIVTPAQGVDYYYLRVRQADGEMAWAGPIWVEAEG